MRRTKLHSDRRASEGSFLFYASEMAEEEFEQGNIRPCCLPRASYTPFHTSRAQLVYQSGRVDRGQNETSVPTGLERLQQASFTEQLICKRHTMILKRISFPYRCRCRMLKNLEHSRSCPSHGSDRMLSVATSLIVLDALSAYHPSYASYYRVLMQLLETDNAGDWITYLICIGRKSSIK